ncbi:CPBP family intramembrane glutamic endopeptidase [Luteimonas sp. A649]
MLDNRAMDLPRPTRTPWIPAVLRVAILLCVMAACWRFGMPLSTGRGTGGHVLLGLALSAVVLATVLLLARRERLAARMLGHHSAGANARAFFLGIALWTLPAAIGLALCTAAGWTTVAVHASPTEVLAAIPVAALGVFLVEAFPEELVFRGYIQGRVGRTRAAWVALLVQAALFIAFAWAVGALASLQQWMFLPGLALILGYARAVGGSVWLAMGVHTAWMTATALLLSPQHGVATVGGVETLQFIAFALLPSATIGTVLGIRAPGFSWRAQACAKS